MNGWIGQGKAENEVVKWSRLMFVMKYDRIMEIMGVWMRLKDCNTKISKRNERIEDGDRLEANYSWCRTLVKG